MLMTPILMLKSVALRIFETMPNFKATIQQKTCAEVHLGYHQRSKMKLFVKIVNCVQLLTIFQ